MIFFQRGILYITGFGTLLLVYYSLVPRIIGSFPGPSLKLNQAGCIVFFCNCKHFYKVNARLIQPFQIDLSFVLNYYNDVIFQPISSPLPCDLWRGSAYVFDSGSFWLTCMFAETKRLWYLETRLRNSLLLSGRFLCSQNCKTICRQTELCENCFRRFFRYAYMHLYRHL